VCSSRIRCGCPRVDVALHPSGDGNRVPAFSPQQRLSVRSPPAARIAPASVRQSAENYRADHRRLALLPYCVRNFSATDRIVAHCELCSWAWSKTIRTARSRSSEAYLAGRGMRSILSLNEPSDKPGTVQPGERALERALEHVWGIGLLALGAGVIVGYVVRQRLSQTELSGRIRGGGISKDGPRSHPTGNFAGGRTDGHTLQGGAERDMSPRY